MRLKDTPEIEAARAELARAKDAFLAAERDLCAAKRKLHKAREAALEAQTGLREGSIVVLKGKRYAYAGIDDRFDDWLLGRPLKKDGTPSQRIVPVYNGWEIEQ